jgi:hypothetical protein
LTLYLYNDIIILLQFFKQLNKNKMKIWRTIIIGTHDDKDKLLSALAKKGIQVTDSKHIWDSSNFRLSSSPKECKLVRISLDELGFT